MTKGTPPFLSTFRPTPAHDCARPPRYEDELTLAIRDDARLGKASDDICVATAGYCHASDGAGTSEL